MAKRIDYSYVRVISTIKGGGRWGRNAGVSHNLRTMSEAADFMDNLRDADLSGVKQIRFLPTEVTFSKPRDAANGLDGIKGRENNDLW